MGSSVLMTGEIFILETDPLPKWPKLNWAGALNWAHSFTFSLTTKNRHRFLKTKPVSIWLHI